MKSTNTNTVKNGTRQRVDRLPRNLLMFMASNVGNGMTGYPNV
jgi:hypothetical protein